MIDTPSFFYTGLTESRLVSSLELEGNGQRVPYRYGLTILTTRGELGQRLADANGLLVKVLIHRADNLYFTYLTSLVNNELYNHAALNIVLGSHGRIVDV